ncbi:MAG TPA: hypothetical protein VGK22_15790 [Candidatus Angelobacter sp.]
MIFTILALFGNFGDFGNSSDCWLVIRKGLSFGSMDLDGEKEEWFLPKKERFYMHKNFFAKPFFAIYAFFALRSLTFRGSLRFRTCALVADPCALPAMSSFRLCGARTAWLRA